jgi:hypothetical protein
VSTLEPDSDGSAWHRLIQRSIPSMSAEEHLERLRYDIDTVLQLDVAFTGDHMTVDSRPGKAQPITVMVHQESMKFHPGGRHEFTLVRQ